MLAKESEKTKPPLGLKPKNIVEGYRALDIISAMQRYSIAKKIVPLEWINELNGIIKEHGVGKGYSL